MKVYRYQQQIILQRGGLELIDEIQTLWILYVTWRRSAASGRLLTIPTQLSAQNRAGEIPSEFYNLLINHYDEEFAAQFQDLLSNRINIESNILNAMVSNDQSNVNTYTQDYIRASDSIAELLGQYSYWNTAQWKTYLYKDLQLYLQQVIAFLTGDFQGEIGIFEEIIGNAQDMGRYMASGIITEIR